MGMDAPFIFDCLPLIFQFGSFLLFLVVFAFAIHSIK